jgi:ribonuclease-3
MSVDPELLDRALTHRSYAYEQGGLPTNERLEFLGDSVLGLVVTEHLFVTYPDLSEGQLAKLRAAVVNSRALADIARQLDLGAVIHLGRGEESTGGRDKSSILADTMEAVIGAVFLQHGVDAARDLVHHLFDPLMAEVATRGAGLDWKTSLQEIASTDGLGVPSMTWSSQDLTMPRPSKPWSTSMTAATDQVPAGTRRRPSRTQQPSPSPR